jgi:methylglutaconyl-CoA hydratase
VTDPVNDPVLLERRGAIGVLTLNRPEVRNALSPTLLERVNARLTELEADSSVRVIVLTGAGSAFCAGADLQNLRALSTASAEDNKRDSSLLAGVLRRLYQYPKPVIAAVNGAAVAGGAGLATACDFVIAAEHATFGYTEVKLGFVAAIVSVFLLRAIGEKHAKELLLTGKLVTALEAHRMGLVNEITSSDTVLERSLDIALEIARNSRTALETTKELLSLLPGMGLDEALRHAVGVNAWTRGTDDLREGVAAFLEKREPDWREKP